MCSDSFDGEYTDIKNSRQSISLLRPENLVEWKVYNGESFEIQEGGLENGQDANALTHTSTTCSRYVGIFPFLTEPRTWKTLSKSPTKR
jgi:hypothetical protein